MRGNGDARDQATAADRNHQGIEFRRLLQHFQTDGALPGDHIGIVVGMHQGHAALVQILSTHEIGGLGQGLAVQHHLAAQLAGIAHLGEWRVARHHDNAFDAQPGGVIGHALGVVTGRHRHHTRGALGGAQRQQLVERAALLEAGGELEVLELQPDLGTGDLRQHPRMGAGRTQHLPAQLLGGGADIGSGDGGGHFFLRSSFLLMAVTRPSLSFTLSRWPSPR